MTAFDLLAGISEREQQGLSTTRVTMSEADFGELRSDIMARTRRSWWRRLKSLFRRKQRPSGLAGNVFSVDVWIGTEDTEPVFA